MANDTYTTPVKIRFAHCDPAGIIFYPRFFEILNGIVEDWFDNELGISFAKLMQEHGLGTPMVNVQAEFIAPCRLGDIVDFSLNVVELGTTSVTINVEGKITTELYIKAQGVLVCSKTDLSGSQPWPAPLKEKMKRYLPAA